MTSSVVLHSLILAVVMTLLQHVDRGSRRYEMITCSDENAVSSLLSPYIYIYIYIYIYFT